MKKFTCSILAAVMFISLLTIGASASEAVINISADGTSLVDDSGFINESLYRQYCKDSSLNINVDDVISANRYLIAQQNSNGIVPYGVGTSTLKLDIAGYFASQDGTSNYNISRIKSQAELAYTNSILLYKNNPAEQDTYRHFYWSFQSTRFTGESATRNFTTNYEYASEVLSDYQKNYDKALNHWTPLDPENAATLASAEAMAQALSDRNDIVKGIKSFSDFKFFSSATIQDFHNNRAGRNACSSYTYIDDAYKAVKSTLIQGENPTDAQRRNVYNSNDWKP